MDVAPLHTRSLQKRGQLLCSIVTACPPRWQEQLILRQQPGFTAGPALSFQWELISQRPAETWGPSCVRQTLGWVLV